MTTPLFLLRCVQIGLSIRDLDLLTMILSMAGVFLCYGAEMLLFLYTFLGESENSWQAVFRELP